MMEWEGLAADLRKRDARLGKLIQKVGAPTVRLERDRFRALARSILAQQLATSAASAITKRFSDLERPFPSPQTILKLKPKSFQSCGVSGQKQTYLCELSRSWVKEFNGVRWGSLEDQIIIEKLTAVKGIGVWTAQMFLIFSLGRPDVLPSGDFGVRKGVQLLYGLGAMPLPKEMPGLLKKWEGASSVASWYVWRGLDQKILVD